VVKPEYFGNFGRHDIEAVAVEANIIVQRRAVPLIIGFSGILKCLTVNYHEVPLYVKICFHRRFD